MTKPTLRQLLQRWTLLPGGILLLALLAACGGGGGGGDPQPTPGGPTPVPTFDLNSRMSDTRSAEVGVDGDDAVLAWIAPGSNPGTLASSDSGQLVLLRANGQSQVALDLPDGTTRVQPCGDRATSSDGRYFAFLAGNEVNPSLYVMDGQGTPNAVGTVSALTCLGGGTFQFSPDGSRFGYISYPAQSSGDFDGGTLRVHTTSSREQAFSYDNVAAFDLFESRAAFISFFLNNQNQATEAAVFVWSGDTPDEISTIYAGDNCRFTSAATAFSTENTLVVMMGRRCSSGTSWELHTIDIAARQDTLALSGTANGGYFNGSRSNNLHPAPDGSTVFYTIPNGVGQNIVNLRATPLVNPVESADVMTSAIMPRLGQSVYAMNVNAFPVVSPDGRWLAVVDSDNSSLNVFDLNQPDVPPINIPAGDSGDTISSMTFTQDSSQLLFVAGGNNRADNSLFALPLAAGSENRVIRGRYTQVIAAPDGQTAAVSEWLSAEQGSSRDYLNVSLIGLANGTSAPLFRGADIIEGRVAEPRFVYLLAWRRG
ncbi:MAG: hypothetical protein SF029_06450 [bacterium]|nr:hypothetical protein [bacterium]